MALLYPDILQHNNSTKALVDITEIRGNSYPINLLSDTGSIPADKRKIGAIVFVSSSQNFYGFYGQTTASWDTATNWRSLGGIDTGSFVSTSSFNSWTGSSTSQFGGTSSYAENAGTSSHILGGKATHIPFFITDTTLATSSLYQSGSTSIIINQDSNTTANPEALYVWQPHPTSFNVISGKGDVNNYLQLNIQNTNNGTLASSDVVATANNGDETTNYIDMGINSDGFIGDIGNENDAYLYSTGKHLHIGNASNYPVQFFAGGLNSDTNKKLELRPDNNHSITGSLNIGNNLIVNQGITGSLLGNASTATTADNAISASHALVADSTAYATIAGNGGVTSIIAGSGITLPFGGTGNVTIVSSGGGGVTIISGSAVTSSFINSDTWTFNHNLGTRTPTITVFDSDYNQIIPQNIQLVDSSSATITFPTLESGFAIASTGGTTGTALSSSYSLFATYADSASYYPETDPIFAAKSASLATTGSNRFIGNQTITGSLIVSSSNSVTVIGPMRITGSLLVSGSTTQIGSNTLTGNTILSGSINVSGSQSFKGSFDLTGSMTVSGSTAQLGNTTLIGNTTITGSMSLGGDILIYGDILPQVSSSYSLGSLTQPWKSIYVQSGSINIQSDIPGGANAELINLGGDVSIKSAGFRVVSSSYTPFRVDPTGRTRLIVPNIPANDIGAFSIIGNASGSYQPVINPSGMVHVTGNDAQAARITVDGFGTNIGTIYVGRHARGTAAEPTPTLSGDTLVRFAGLGYATSSYFPVVGAVPTSLEFQATENYSTSSYGSRAAFYTYANGAVSRSLSAIIDATGITIPSSSLLFGTASWALNAVSASYAQTASYINPLKQDVIITGSLKVSGSLTEIGNTVLSGSLTLSSGSALNINDGFYVNGQKQFNYGQFYNTTTQSGSQNTARPITYNASASAVGIQVISGSRITVANAGLYNVQVIAQLGNTSNTTIDFDLWFEYTGSSIPNSNSQVQLTKVASATGRQLASWNILVPIQANDYVECYVNCSANTGQLQSVPIQANPTRPAVPSVKTTVTQIA